MMCLDQDTFVTFEVADMECSGRSLCRLRSHTSTGTSVGEYYTMSNDIN